MKASIINIGDELLIGQVINTNATWMAKELNDINIIVDQIVLTSDTEKSISAHVKRCMTESDVVIITGGLGPTKDDITKSTLCKMYNDHLVVHEETCAHVENYFKNRNFPMLEVNQWQSMVPSRCTVLFNRVGTAPGMWFKENDKIIIALPGVPYEMKYLMTEHVLPRLAKINSNSAIVHKTILTCGIGESFLADVISDWENSLPIHIKLAYLPNRGQVRLRLSAYGENKEIISREVDEQLKKLQPLIDEYIYGYDDDSLISTIGNILRDRKITISTAESCTGGNVAALITSISGASDYFTGSIVSYDNDVKVRTLNVPLQIIERYGAVSEECAIAMARGCLSTLRTDYAIATTGISGPNGESENKALGLVYIAIASKNGVRCAKYVFKNTRVEHQMRTANQALFNLWELLKNEW